MKKSRDPQKAASTYATKAIHLENESNDRSHSASRTSSEETKRTKSTTRTRRKGARTPRETAMTT